MNLVEDKKSVPIPIAPIAIGGTGLLAFGYWQLNDINHNQFINTLTAKS